MNIVIIKMTVILFLIAVIIVNYLATAIPFNNQTQSDISDKHPNYFTPTGFTFSIWGIIYLMLGIFVIRIALQDALFFEQSYVSTMIVFYLISCVLNMLWLLAWHYLRMEYSTIIMVALLITLIITYLAIPQQEFLLKATFSLYTAWISIATIANITILLTTWNIPLFKEHEIMWFIIMITVGLLLSAIVVFSTRDVLYGVVFIWAYYGIMMKHIHHEQPYFKTSGPLYYLTFTFILIVLLTGSVFIQNGFQFY